MDWNTTARPSTSWIYLASFAAFLFLFLRFFLLPCIPIEQVADQLLFYSRGLHVVNGSVMYRDFFEMVTPGNNLLDAALLKIFGVHAWVMPAADVAVGLALFLVITLTAAELFEGFTALLPGMLFLAFIFSSAEDVTHHWFSTLAAQAAVLVLLRGRDTKRLVLAGLLCALSALFTQTQGAFAFAAIVVYLVWTGRKGDRVRQLSAFVLPFAALTGAVLGYYAVRAGWSTLYFDLVTFPVRILSLEDGNTPRTYLHQFVAVHGVADLLRTVPYLFVYALVPYIYFVAGYRLWRNRQTLSARIWNQLMLLHLAGFGLFLGVIAGPRFFRLCTVSPSAVVLVVWLMSGPVQWAKTARRVACGVAAVFLLMLAVHKQLAWHKVLTLPIGRVAFTDRGDAAEFEWMAARTHPGDTFANKTALAFYLELKTPTRVEFINDGEFTRPEQVSEVVAWMQHHQPRYVVMQPLYANYRPEHSHSQPYRQYVQARYHLAQVFSLNKDSQPEQVWELNESTRPQ